MRLFVSAVLTDAWVRLDGSQQQVEVILSRIAQLLLQLRVISIEIQSITLTAGGGGGVLTFQITCTCPSDTFRRRPKWGHVTSWRFVIIRVIEVARPFDFKSVRASDSEQVAQGGRWLQPPPRSSILSLNRSPECNNTYFSLYNWTGWQSHLKSADESPSWQWSVWPVTWLEWGRDNGATWACTRSPTHARPFSHYLKDITLTHIHFLESDPEQASPKPNPFPQPWTCVFTLKVRMDVMRTCFWCQKARSPHNYINRHTHTHTAVPEPTRQRWYDKICIIVSNLLCNKSRLWWGMCCGGEFIAGTKYLLSTPAFCLFCTPPVWQTVSLNGCQWSKLLFSSPCIPARLFISPVRGCEYNIPHPGAYKPTRTNTRVSHTHANTHTR